jgi:hypothetical protein
MKTPVLALVPVLVVAGGIAAAAQDVFHFEQFGGAVAGLTFERPVDVMSVEPLDLAEPVTGAPYTADITTDIVLSLADGNRIERRSTSTVARDSRGRVRREQQLAAIGPILPQQEAQIVTITDPVAGVHYSFSRERKVATRAAMPVIRRIERGVRVRPPMAAAAAAGPAAGRDARSEPLGTRDIEGVRAEGTRSTVTIPAGAIGNQAPIEIVSERWYSPDLQAVVMSRRVDPRFGETTFRMENIVRAEPAAELFQVPADYKVDSVRPFGPGTFGPASPR